MQQAVLKIRELGVPPKGFENSDPFYDEDTLQTWDAWIDAAVAIQMPITWEEAEILIQCCPTERMAGVEWTILHCIESVFSSELDNPEEIKRFQNLIAKCNSDMMKNLLLQRLPNHKA